jgi:hypothetical protein
MKRRLIDKVRDVSNVSLILSENGKNKIIAMLNMVIDRWGQKFGDVMLG